MPKPELKRRPVVALLIETSNAYARGILEGIVSYVRRHDPWSLYLPEMRRGEVPVDWPGRWKGDGIIARIENVEMARAVKRAKLPTVDVSAGRHLPQAPWVETDDAAIARLAVEHLAERGFRNFAFCGKPSFAWSRRREEEFQIAARARGTACESYQAGDDDGPTTSWAAEHRRLGQWVRDLPKPVGILACYDIQAQRLLDACREVGTGVPEEAAVLGVDNDELMCDLCSPPLSSIIPNTLKTGYAAAEILDKLMRGETPANEAQLIPPLGVDVRQSTDILALDDRDVAAAVRFIREHACDGIQVGDVLRHVPLSRRVLESRFLKHVGRTPHDEILRIKLDRVKRLLTDTDLTLDVIADRAGFRHSEYLSVAFKRVIGKSPSGYRQENTV
ncbi:MAG: DNA-binding transcriptional regulator [Pirellulales bacterium]